MSYLNPLRLNFSGQFQAAPSTVNNDPVHFDNRSFRPSYQKLQTSKDPNGWWNPQGDACWRLIGCAVTSAWMDDKAVAATDPILKYLVADSDRTVAGKIVDLDPEQQLVSEIWGMQVRICRADGTNLLRANYRTAAFADIWDRSTGGGGDIGAGAMYQSVLYNLEWGDVRESEFLSKLKDSAVSGLLSIKFNVDGYNMDITSPDFTRGRIVGTIGPAAATEPEHFVLGRHFMAAAGAGANFFAPQGKINFCAAVVDEAAGKVRIDLGNALPSTTAGGPFADLGILTLGYFGPPDSTGNSPILTLGAIPYLDAGWYENTAGVVAVPADGVLSPTDLTAIRNTPLVLFVTAAGGSPDAAISESPDGLYVRADKFVFRLDPGDEAQARLFATAWGQPYGGARIVSVFDPSQLQTQAASQIGVAPNVASPTSAVDFPARTVTDAQGVAVLPVRVSDPGNPRKYIDGQVYGIRPMLEETLDFGSGYVFSPWEFVSILLWNDFKGDNPPTWFGSLQPIFQQYANLYPMMGRFLDLSDYDSVAANVRLLRLAFGLPAEDANSMPVTRDLSGGKRKAILKWLSEPGADGKPLKGSPAAAAKAAPASDTGNLQPLPATEVNMRGGKSAAAARRIGLRRPGSR